jgi:hypothetical protein
MRPHSFIQKNQKLKNMNKKNILLLSTTLFLFAGAITLSSCGGSTDKKTEPNNETNPISKDSTKATAYVCPMGCEGSGSDQPGKCPKCGMDLVKNEKDLK